MGRSSGGTCKTLRVYIGGLGPPTMRMLTLVLDLEG